MLLWLLAALIAVNLVVLAIPTTRRVWAFGFYAKKYLWLFALDLIGWRRLWAYLMNKRYEKLTRPVALRMFCEDMGPTFLKFAQLVASSEGMFPKPYVSELGKCLDSVRPFSYDEVIETLHAELGDERAAELESIEREPLASASIAQVHNARLTDGTQVVVKVQRPGIASRISADVKVMRFFAEIAQRFLPDAKYANPCGIVDDLDQTLHEEIDFCQEAENLDRFNRIMKELGHANVRAPVPQWGLTTERVLVMERFDGIRVDDVDEIHARGVDTEESLVRGLRAWFQCVVFYGFFHGDVHAGNLMLLDDGDIGFLDFGIVGRFEERQRFLVTDWMISFATKNYRRLGEVVVEMGGAPPDVDMDAFVADLGRVYEPMLDANFGDVNFGEVMPQIQRVARSHSMTLPREFVLITKQLLYFDRYAKLLAPQLNIFKDPRLLVGMMEDILKARAAASA